MSRSALQEQAVPGASLVAMPGLVHLAGLQCPAEVSDLIDVFVRAHD